MFKLPHVPTAEELVDKSFRRGAKKANAAMSTKGHREVRLRKAEEIRVSVIADVIDAELTKIVKEFPSYERLPEFYRRLLDIKIDHNTYKKSLGAMQWCLKNIRALKRDALKEVKEDPHKSKAFLGRCSSIVKRIAGDLDKLSEIKRMIKDFPTIQDMPTLVISGYPNAGKSTYMKTLTGSAVKIAAYPFTTKDILIGHRKIRHTNHQIIDSPGLLDRSMEKRNSIELQAILAMEELADAILFILDPKNEEDAQLSLLAELSEKFTCPLYVAINKSDITEKETIERLARKLERYKPYTISAKNEEDCVNVFTDIFGKTQPKQREHENLL